jgi:carbon monoxide dehydrogenase subunit G
MVTVAATTRVAATPDAVFDVVDTPENHERFSPSLSSVYAVRTVEGGGHRALYTYRLFGIPLTGSVEAVEHERPARLRFALRGGVDGEMDWQFEADGAETVVTCEATFTVPGGALASLLEPLVRRYNQQELEETLANLAEMVRTTEPTTPP